MSFLVRVIGAKKDQFFINSKLSNSKTEVTNILEVAGFSVSNPYHIVKQGQINRAACCSSQDRLRLIRQVAGVEVFTEKNKKNDEEIFEIQRNMVELEEGLSLVEQRVESLTEQKEQLEEWRKLEKQRRTAEFALVEAELAEVRVKMKKADEELATANMNGIEQIKKLTHERMILGEEEKSLKRLKLQGRIVEVERERMVTVVESLVGTDESLLLKAADLEKVGEEYDEELEEEIEQEMEQMSIRLQNVFSEVANISVQISSKEEKLEKATQERDGILARGSRAAQFRSREERNIWIHKVVNQLEIKENEKREQMNQLNLFLEDGRVEQEESRLRQREINVAIEEQKVCFNI